MRRREQLAAQENDPFSVTETSIEMTAQMQTGRLPELPPDGFE